MAKKFLCICEGGCVRSAALAWQLKVIHNQDALAGSWRWNSSATMEMLCQWADYIIIMQQAFLEKIPSQFHPKVRAVDVGPDRWGSPTNSELTNYLAGVAADWAKRDFNI